jgi:hypothetical protein
MSDETTFLPLKEAATRLGISVDTARRRLRAGELTGEQRKTPQGFAWYVEVPAIEEPVLEAAPAPAGLQIEVEVLKERLAGMERLLEEVRADRDSWKDQASTQSQAAQELRLLIAQAQALPASTGSGNTATASPTREAIEVDVAPRPAPREKNRFKRAWAAFTDQ